MSTSESSSPLLTRRGFLNFAALGTASVAVSACVTTAPPPLAPPPAPTYQEPPEADYATMYGPISDGGFDVPAVPYQKIDPKFLRQIVPDPTGQKPGTSIVDTSNHFLYLVQPGGQAIRYGVGLGRAGFAWSGDAVVQWKQRWPKWTPPDEMIARQPELEEYSVRNGGMPGGLKNPLGARALYLFQGNVDTLYRLHGSPEWRSIGKSVSSGCVRLMNQDIIDLFDRVPNKTPVIVTDDIRNPDENTNHKAIPIDSGVPTGSVVLGAVKSAADSIF